MPKPLRFTFRCLSDMHARCCAYYDDFGYRHKLPVDRLLSQRYKVNQLRILSKYFMAGIHVGLQGIRSQSETSLAPRLTMGQDIAFSCGHEIKELNKVKNF